MNTTLFGRRCLHLLVLVVGCQSWTGSRGSPNAIIAATSPERVRITTADGQHLVLRDAHVVADSVIGITDRNERVAIPTTHLTSAATKRIDVGETVGLTVGLVLLGLGALVVALSHWPVPSS